MNRFFDTNILVYASLEGPKRELALRALADGGTISAQVLNEFTNVSRKKYGRAWTDIEAALTAFRERLRPIAPLTGGTHSAAFALVCDYGFAFYDALIVAAAIEAGCDTLYSEDMPDGRAIGGLTIRNPFQASPP